MWNEIHQISQTLERIEKRMSALDDLKTSQANIAKATADIAAYLKTLAANIQGGITEVDAEAIAKDLNEKAATLETLTQPTAAAAPVA